MPVAEREAGLQCRRQVVGELQPELVLERALDALARHAEHRRARVVLVVVEISARDGPVGGFRGGRRLSERGELQRLARVLKMIGADQVRQAADLVADRRRRVRAVETAVHAEQVEVLREALHLGIGFEVRGHARRDRDGRAHRVARVQRGVRAVDHVDLVDVVGEDHRPARREREGIAEEVAEQEAIGIDEPARRLRVARAAHGDRRIHVADEALANRHVRHVLEHVFRRDDVPVFELLRSDRRDAGGEIGIERWACRLRRHDDGRERCRFARGVLRARVVGGRGCCGISRLRHQRQRNARERQMQARRRAPTHGGAAAVRLPRSLEEVEHRRILKM